MPSALCVGKQLHGCSELPLQLEPRADNLLPRLGFGDLTEIDVGSCMRTDVEALPVERPNLIPRHPGMTTALRSVPPRNDVRSDPLADDEEGCGQGELHEHGNRIFEIVSVSVIKRDGEVTIRRQAALQPVHEVSQRDHPEVTPEKSTVTFEHGDADRQPVRTRSVLDTMKRHDDRGVSQQNRREARLEDDAAEKALDGCLHWRGRSVPPSSLPEVTLR